jgi:hypothetical protein
MLLQMKTQASATSGTEADFRERLFAIKHIVAAQISVVSIATIFSL